MTSLHEEKNPFQIFTDRHEKNRARNMQAVPRLWYMCHESNQKEELGKISRGYTIIKSIISLFI